MSTRGLIAIEDADRKCRSIFVHFDMYIDGAGETLIKYYKTIKRVEKLLSLGDISSLGGGDCPIPTTSQMRRKFAWLITEIMVKN